MHGLRLYGSHCTQQKTDKNEVIQNRCVRYARRAVDSTCIFNNELRSRCNTVSVEQHIPTLAERKPLKTMTTILASHTIINQTTKQKRLKISSKVTGSSNLSTLFTYFTIYSNIFNYYSNPNFKASSLAFTCDFITL